MASNNVRFKIVGQRFKHFAYRWVKTIIGQSKPQVEDGQELNILKPILVNSAGRSGSTLLMQLLGTSPHIVFDREYPFEVRYLTYFLRWALLLNETGRATQTWNPAELLKHPTDQLLGPLPYPKAGFWSGGTIWPNCFETAWKEFSKASIAQVGENNGSKIRPKYYAEKTSTWVLGALEKQTIDYNVILLIRDPRDVFLSVNAFDKQRGFSGFGRLSDETDLDFARRMTKSFQNMHKNKIITSPNSILVKYEKLATDLPQEAHRLGQWLNLEFDAALVKEQEVNFKHHMTSGSAEQSVERWRHELPKELNDVFIQEVGEELSYFGYET